MAKFGSERRGMLTLNVGEAGGFVKLDPASLAPEFRESTSAPPGSSTTASATLRGMVSPPFPAWSARRAPAPSPCAQPTPPTRRASTPTTSVIEADLPGPGRRREARPHPRSRARPRPLSRRRIPAGHRGAERRRDRRLHSEQRAEHLPPGRHLQDGSNDLGRGQRPPAGLRRRTAFASPTPRSCRRSSTPNTNNTAAS